MNNFSISQLEQFSGIKAHTIRIWEQRYRALKPNRSQGNTRYYDTSQLRRLLNIVSLMNTEYKVSELCLMPDEKLFTLIRSRLITDSAENTTEEYFISQLIGAGVCFDSGAFEKIFATCIGNYGIRDVYIKIIYPLLDRIGLMWSSDSIPPAQEHFISNIIRQKLFSSIDKLPAIKSSKDSWILFLPENELHEIGLLFSYFLIRLAGKNVVYLGANLPLDTLINAVKEIAPTSLLFFCVHNDTPREFEKYKDALIKTFKGIKIYISGNERLIRNMKKVKALTWLKTVSDLENVVRN